MTDTAYEPLAELEPLDDDLGDPFENVPEEWKRLTGVAWSHFSINELPPLFRPFVGPAMLAFAARLARDPAGSRAGAVEILGECICALGITSDELACWDAAGLPYASPGGPDGAGAG